MYIILYNNYSDINNAGLLFLYTEQKRNFDLKFILSESHSSTTPRIKVLNSTYIVFHKTKNALSYLYLNNYSSPSIMNN